MEFLTERVDVLLQKIYINCVRYPRIIQNIGMSLYPSFTAIKASYFWSDAHLFVIRDYLFYSL